MADLVTIFLCGDVMTGRGIDQILPHQCDPVLHEPYMPSAKGYVELAERAAGPIPKPVDFPYIWGDALTILEQAAPDVRIINLETAVTTSGDWWRGKGINYRMHPANIPCLTAAGIDCCTLANNHILDWGYAGLVETLETLANAGIKSAGAGRNMEDAAAPAILEIAGKGRAVTFSFGDESCGIPEDWAAGPKSPGVNLLPDLSERALRQIGELVAATRRQGDIIIASIHWGGNWGYAIPPEQQYFAHRLIADAGIDAVYGHSSHHVKGIEVYRDRPIFYGCGDFINDYEGISGYESFRGDLSLMYFADFDPETGRLVHLRMAPTRLRRFQVTRASAWEAGWLRDTLVREGKRLGTHAMLHEDNAMTLHWS